MGGEGQRWGKRKKREREISTFVIKSSSFFPFFSKQLKQVISSIGIIYIVRVCMYTYL